MASKKRIALVVLAVSGLAAGAAAAHGFMDRMHRGGNGGHGAHLLIRALDADGDRRVTVEEARGVQLDRLQRFDRDDDGTLSLEESAPLFAELLRPRMVDAFQRLDEDGDGAVTEPEMLEPAEMIARLDRDGDGDLDRDDRRRWKGGHDRQ